MIPKYDQMYKVILKCLKDKEEITLKVLRDRVSEILNLTDNELNELLPTGKKTIFSSRVDWATTYLKNAKLIDKPTRGNIIITKRGLSTISSNIDIIDNNYLSKFQEFQEYLEKSKKKISSIDEIATNTHLDNPDEILEKSYLEINSNLENELLELITKISPISFEKLVIDLLSKMGYGSFENSGKTTSKTNDEGIDGIIMEDKLGFNLIYIQAKKWEITKSIGRPEIQKFVGALSQKLGKGLFVTTANFSRHAIEYASSNHIILINGEKLVKLMIEYNFCIRVKKIFEIKEIDSELIEEY
ncbi:MAG: restriction endonuclease [Cetobacterium sp.]